MIDVSVIQNATGAFVDDWINKQVVTRLTGIKHRITREIANEYGKVETKGRTYFDPRMNPTSISPGQYQLYLEVDADSIDAAEIPEAYADKRELAEVIWDVVKEADWPVPVGLMTLKLNTQLTLEQGRMSRKVRFTALIDHDRLPLAELKTEMLKSIVAMAAETPQSQIPDTATEAKMFDSSKVNAKKFSAAVTAPILSALHDHFQNLVDVRESKRKYYVSFRTRYTLLYCVPHKNSIDLRINLTKRECQDHGFQYDVKSHYGQCKGKITIRALSELEDLWPLIEKSYKRSKDSAHSSKSLDKSDFKNENDADSFLKRVKSRGLAI